MNFSNGTIMTNAAAKYSKEHERRKQQLIKEEKKLREKKALDERFRLEFPDYVDDDILQVVLDVYIFQKN